MIHSRGMGHSGPPVVKLFTYFYLRANPRLFIEMRATSHTMQSLTKIQVLLDRGRTHTVCVQRESFKS